jgi:hypothetical protein
MIGGLIMLMTAALAPADSLPSPFMLACVQGGGTAGQAILRNGNNNHRLYAGQIARLSLSFAPAGPNDIFAINLTRADASAGEPANFSMRPGDGAVFNASKLTLESMGGTVGKSVDYCLRVQ